MRKSGIKMSFVMLCLLIVAFSFFIYSEREMLVGNPFPAHRVFENLSHAVTADDGSMLVIDKGKTRVTVLEDYKISATINGAKSSDGFFYAEHAATLRDKIYVADVMYAEGSSRIAEERVIQFSADGRYEKILFERLYSTEEMPYQYSTILDMRVYDGALTFIIRNGDELDLYGIVQETPSLLRTVSTGEAEYLNRAMYDAGADCVRGVTKRGYICQESVPGVLSIAGGSAVRGIPWDLSVDSEGTVYLTDLASRSISLADGATAVACDSIIYRLNINKNDIISYTDGESIFQVRTDMRELFSGAGAPYSSSYYILRLITWFLTIVTGAAVLYIAARFLLWVVRSSRSIQTKYMVAIMVSTLLTSTIVAVSTLGSSLTNSTEKSEYNITQAALSISGLSHHTIGDDLEELNELSDYGNPAFQRIHESLDPICESAWGQGFDLYYVLYKYHGYELCVVTDFGNYTGIVFPYEDFSGIRGVAAGQIPYFFERESDALGSWSYAIAPVFNSEGAIVGLIEMGSNLDVETLQARRQIQDIISSTAALLVLFLLLFSEISVVMEHVPRLRSMSRDDFIPELIRPLIFLSFLAGSTYTAFIPQLSLRIFQDSALGFSQSLGAALPLSAEMMVTAITAAVGGILIDRLGLRRVLLGGVIVEAAGLMFTAAAVSLNSYGVLLAGVSLTGAGAGIVIVAGNTMPLFCSGLDRRNDLYASVNVGTVAGIVVGIAIGSYACQFIGYSGTFLLSGIILLPALWLCMKCSPRPLIKAKNDTALKEPRYDDGGMTPDGQKQRMPLRVFLRQKSVYSFMLFLMLPFLMILCFKDYIFPLFASEHGYSDVEIGNALMFSGAIAIFLAPPVSTALLKNLGARVANILAVSLFAAGLLLFALWPTLLSSIIVVYVIYIAGCYGYVVNGVYFSSMRASQEYGAGKSMGVFSLFQNLSLAVGPLVFGVLLVFGYQTASLVIALAGFILIGLFALLTPRKDSPETISPENEDIPEKLPESSSSMR